MKNLEVNNTYALKTRKTETVLHVYEISSYYIHCTIEKTSKREDGIYTIYSYGLTIHKFENQVIVIDELYDRIAGRRTTKQQKRNFEKTIKKLLTIAPVKRAWMYGEDTEEPPKEEPTEEPTTEEPTTEDRVLLVDSNRGIHIPKTFALNYWHLLSNPEQFNRSLLTDVYNEDYWTEFAVLEQSAEFKGPYQGYRLYIDNDLWLIK